MAVIQLPCDSQHEGKLHANTINRQFTITSVIHEAGLFQ